MISSAALAAYVLLVVFPLNRETHSVADVYSDLTRLAEIIPHNGLSANDKLSIQKDRQELLEQPLESVSFLVEKLEEMNSQEATKSTQHTNEYERGAASQHILKVWICFILADLHKQSSTNRRSIEDALANSYTPSITAHEQGLTNMLWATLSVGADSIPILLHLANSSDVRLRCGALDALRQVSQKLDGRSLSKMICKAPQNSRDRQIASWRDWWEKAGRNEQFPKFPSFFDSL